jgi:hypothetical protein
MNNFYAYRFEGTKRFIFIPWDKDNSFDWEYKPIFEGVAENVLTRRLMSFPKWRNAYLQYLVEAAAIAGGANGWLASEIERLYSNIRLNAMTDPNKQCTFRGVVMSCGAEDFEGVVSHLRTFAAARADYVVAEARSAGYVAAGR